MCGIAGLYRFADSRPVRREDVDAMRDTLMYRGPDAAGTYMSPDGRVGLGSRRLKIIDLSEAGAQPMTSGALHIVYNGEIYNFKELRAEFEKKGHRFASQSDTEVILAAYEEYGTECVKRFNGMFAFVIWDDVKKLLFAARDHVGIKPFYYAVQNGSFYFGSEIKAILAHPAFQKRFAKENASYYLTFASLPAPHTLFEDVHKLPAGHTLIIEEGKAPVIAPYWSPLDGEYQKDASEEQYAEEVLKILTDSIRGQMVSDVPFGCFLSGGIDSSVNAALMSRALGAPVETFSVAAAGYGEKYDELRYARQVADTLGSHRHELVVGHEALMRFLPVYANHFDDPNGDPITFLVYYLSELIKKSGVTVAQVGEGADELFVGYEATLRATRLYERVWRHAARLPEFLKRLPHMLLKNEYARRFAQGEEPYWGHAIAFTPTDKELLLTPAYRKTLAPGHEYAVLAPFYKEADAHGLDALARMSYVDIKHRIPEFLLQRVDRMAMAHSVEARVPFLDKRLVELAFRIPERVKVKDGELKHVLKRAVQGIVPDEILRRKKQGFGAPFPEWLAKPETAAPLLKTIENSGLREEGILNGDRVRKLRRPFEIWTVLTLSLWHDRWIRASEGARASVQE
ncbi:asparagine synthase (glutamine-hydrolyzing) [Candidatus Jorgensenbacteria bacterium GWA1_54_12]|uniref:asparagine synthase (glutamine-hydrolyzing) n=1 Tax=Candidatus Jorgensenbacteria bacterium GWA1_54_12 TaxID=1798468 RepID=A0A1F6BIG0_9BACT|nr:MAG: asparagine synthase (glutamine-hydrolyzing) [Candidatus Jorgensenbacteria bacterium GWA1_54_12]